MEPQKGKRHTQVQTITIRPAVEADAALIANLVNANALQGKVLPRSLSSVQKTLDNWIVATAGDELLGCVSLLRYTSGLVEVRSLVVQERYRGLGIGSRLMKALLREAQSRQIPTLFALTRKVPFFERFGFTMTERHFFPEKVWLDCQQCPLVDRCDETAMVLDLERLEPNSDAAQTGIHIP